MALSDIPVPLIRTTRSGAASSGRMMRRAPFADDLSSSKARFQAKS